MAVAACWVHQLLSAYPRAARLVKDCRGRSDLEQICWGVKITVNWHQVDAPSWNWCTGCSSCSDPASPAVPATTAALHVESTKLVNSSVPATKSTSVSAVLLHATSYNVKRRGRGQWTSHVVERQFKRHGRRQWPASSSSSSSSARVAVGSRIFRWWQLQRSRQ